MNQNNYQLVFNAARGCVMAVSEATQRCGKGAGSLAGKNVGGARRIACSAIFAFALTGLSAALVQAQIIADPAAPSNQRPTVLETPNRLPLVNIQAPSAAGVSRNTYQQFDVGVPGAVLNNSRTNVQTQIGGWVQGNPWLTSGEARIILNEVNSQNPSQLNGFIEVGGLRAEVIIANPAGIHVNGAGFINASRATLTTGTPVMNGGNLEAYRVQGGTISINGSGLNATLTDYTGILARAIEVNASIHAQQLHMVAGVSTVDAQQYDVQSDGAPNALGTAPAFALDVSELGGMYAGHIRLVGTEAGVGVRHHGSMAASVGHVQLDVNGWLSSSGMIEARQGHVSVHTIGAQTHSGRLVAAGDLTLHSGDKAQRDSLTQTGTVRAGLEAQFRASDIHNSGQIDAQRLDMEVGNLINSGAIWQSGTQALEVLVGQLDNQTGATLGRAAALTDDSQPSQSEAGSWEAVGAGSSGGESTQAANPEQSDPEPQPPFVPLAMGQVVVSGQLLQHEGATLSGAGLLHLYTTQDLHNAGMLRAQTLQAHGDRFATTDGTIDAYDVQVQVHTVDMQAGSVVAHQAQFISAIQHMGQGAQIEAQTPLRISTGHLHNAGQMRSATDLNIAVAAQSDNQAVQGNANTNTMQADGALVNSGTLAAAGNTSINAASLNNSSGMISSQTGAVILAAKDINNTSGTILAASTLTAQAGSGSVINIQGQLLAQGDLSVSAAHSVHNTQGLIQSNAGVSIHTGQLNNSQTSDDNQGIVGQDVTLTVASLNSTQGQVLAGHDLTVYAQNTIDNTQGTLNAQRSLTLQDRALSTDVQAHAVNTAAALRQLGITNTGGQMVANNTQAPHTSSVHIAARSFGLDGTLLSGGDMALDQVGSLHTQAGQEVRAGGNLSVQLHGASAGSNTFDNAGQWQAGQDLTILADHIHNQASGDISSQGTTTLNTTQHASGTITNRAVVDGVDTHIQTHTLSNTGTGRIYGDHVAIAAHTLVNREETVGGTTSAATIAARERLDIGAQHITNREGAWLFSAGDMAIGGALDANYRAIADGSANAQTLNNNSATIESLGNMTLAANVLRNTNEHLNWSIEIGEISQHREDFSSTLYRTYTQTTQKAVVTQSAPGQILSTGNIHLDVPVQGLNQDSVIVAGGNISGTVNTINNQSTRVNVSAFRSGTTYDWGVIGDDCLLFGLKCDPLYGWRSNPYSETITRQVDLPTVRFEQHTPTISGTTVAARGHNGQTQGTTQGNIQTVAAGLQDQKAQSTATPSQRQAALAGLGTPAAPSIVLPNSSLFSIQPGSNARYLVETDPRFANYRQWLSSDYMLQALAIDPATTQKRLGDGFYEQRLIREQVAALTGYRFLGDYRSDEAQYQALMTAGATFAQAQQLRPGIALSAAQVAQLTSDIVWLVAETVTLPDGTTTTALAPRVYLAPRTGDLAADGTLFGGAANTGSLISARDIQLSLSGDLNNSGTIAGRQMLDLSAQNITNSGLLQGDVAWLRVEQDIDITGGQVAAQSGMALQAGGNITVETTTTQGQGAAGSGVFASQHIDRVAGLYLSGPAGVLLASAGNDINLIAAQVHNAGSAATQLQAGGNVNLGTVQTGLSSNVTHDASNFARVEMNQEVGTQITGAGAVNIQAQNDITARAAQVNAQGALSLQATDGHVSLEAGQSSTSIAAGSHASSRGLLGSSSTTTRSSSHSTTAQASELGGQTVNIQSGANTRIVGSNLLADQDLNIRAGGDLSIEAAQNTQSSSSFTQTRRSGLFSSGGIGFTIGSQQQSTDAQNQRTTAAASTVGVIDGNVNLNAGQTYTQTGSDVLTPAGDININAQRVNIEEARETSRQSVEQRARQSGLTVAITSPVISAVQTINQQIEAAGHTQSSRLKALAAANVALAGIDAYQQVQAGQGQNIHGQDGQILTGKTKADGTPITRDANMADKAGGISLSVSLGSSGSQSNSSQTSDTARGSSVTAGGEVNITASGGGANSDITLQGSTVKAGGNTRLSAEDEVRLLAAANTSTQNNTNRSSSASVGVSMGIGGQQAGLSLNASASRAQGQGAGSGTTYTHSQISGQAVELTSGGNTTLQGAVVQGDQVTATVGGDLFIQTLQDSNRYNERQRSAGVSVSVPIGPGGPGAVSGSLNAGRTDIQSNYQSATEQSGIRAGDGGFQVKVDGDTTLVGAAITSSEAAQDAGVNQLQTAALSSSDLHNTASASVSSSGISVGSDMFTQGQYGLAKTGVANLANQASDPTQQQGQTISAISSAHIVITDEARHQALTNETAEQTTERLQANAQGTTHTGVSAADVQAMRRQVEAERAIRNEAVKQFSIIGDQVYRKETEDKTVHLMQCETADKERCGVSEVVSLEQVRAVNNAITAFNNGMLNTEQEALMTAYMQASGMQLQDGLLVIVNPRLDNIVAEATWAVYKKVQEVFGFGSSSVGELNLALEAIAAAQGALYNTQAHSAGNFGVAEMNRRLEAAGRTDAAIGTQTMFGSPVNAQGQADRVHTITGGQGTVQQSTHVNDFVSTLFGNNPPTGGEENTPALRSHSAYTGDLTTSGSMESQVQIPDAITPQELRRRTNEAWGAGQFSQPETVVPRNQVEPLPGN